MQERIEKKVADCIVVKNTNGRCTAWEPTNLETAQHSNVASFDGRWYGDITTREFECSLPPGEERSKRLEEWKEDCLENAEAMIRRAFPRDLFMCLTNDRGVPFNIRVVKDGESYGKNRSLDHKGFPMVEFYDARYDYDRDEYGQTTGLGHFVTRYFAKLLIDAERGLREEGLKLDGGVPDWFLDSSNIEELIEPLRHIQEAHEESAEAPRGIKP